MLFSPGTSFNAENGHFSVKSDFPYILLHCLHLSACWDIWLHLGKKKDGATTYVEINKIYFFAGPTITLKKGMCNSANDYIY